MASSCVLVSRLEAVAEAASALPLPEASVGIWRVGGPSLGPKGRRRCWPYHSKKRCSTYKWASKNNHPEAQLNQQKPLFGWFVVSVAACPVCKDGPSESPCLSVRCHPDQRTQKKRTFLPEYEGWPRTPAPSTAIDRLFPQFTACGSPRRLDRAPVGEGRTLSYLIQNAALFCLGSGAPCWPSWSRVWA